MLKRYSQVFVTFLFATDMVMVALAWLAAYYLRMESGFFEVIKLPPSLPYVLIIPGVCLLFGFSMRLGGLYLPRRTKSPFDEIYRIAKVSTVSMVLLLAVLSLYRDFTFSRVALVSFWLLTVMFLSGSRMTLRAVFRALRRRGYNLRHMLIVGAGDLGREVLHRVRGHPEAGLEVLGFLGKDSSKIGQQIEGVKILGVYEDIQRILQTHLVDQVVIALPIGSYPRLEGVLKGMQEEFVDVRIVPDLFQYMTLRGGVEDFDGMPMVRLQDTPMVGWNAFGKRLFDVVFSSVSLVLLLPFLLAIASAIKLFGGRGPVLYKQERMGFDGRIFNIYKFRTMHTNAEQETGAVWAKRDDPRRTLIGRLLRAISLDELPQLFNVFRGDMSLVGPRPERPELIGQFQKMIPRYMLRHKVKAGLTGLAQIRGWRGNTSLEKRIENDLYYIEHWSFRLDFEILLKTVPAVLSGKEAY